MTAVRRLQLVGIEDERPKGPPAPGVVRVAIATRDMKGLNAHFGSAPRFAVYDVTKDGWDFVEAVAFDDASDESGAHRNEGEDRIGPKVDGARRLPSAVLPGDRRAVGRQGGRRPHPSDQDAAAGADRGGARAHPRDARRLAAAVAAQGSRERRRRRRQARFRRGLTRDDGPRTSRPASTRRSSRRWCACCAPRTDTASGSRKPDAEILADFIVTKEQRRQIPIIGDPDPDMLGRVEKFYIAVGLDIERATGRMASPMMKMSHEGFGRVVLTRRPSGGDRPRACATSIASASRASTSSPRPAKSWSTRRGSGSTPIPRSRTSETASPAQARKEVDAMSDVEALKTEIRKLSARAITPR